MSQIHHLHKQDIPLVQSYLTPNTLRHTPWTPKGRSERVIITKPVPSQAKHSLTSSKATLSKLSHRKIHFIPSPLQCVQFRRVLTSTSVLPPKMAISNEMQSTVRTVPSSFTSDS